MSVRALGVIPIESPPTTYQYLSLQNFARSAAVWLEWNSSVNLCHPSLGVPVNLGSQNGTNLNVVPTFLFDFYTHYMPILHCLATIRNATDRHADDRAIGIGRPCSIGDLITDNNIVKLIEQRHHHNGDA